MADTLTICEVGPRDGLQSQPVHVSLDDKRTLIQMLYDAGVRTMEVTSFVSPKAVPQLADAGELMPFATSLKDLRALALVLNDQGYRRARALGTRDLTVVVVCSDTLALKNNGQRSRETLETAHRIVALARQESIRVRVCLAAAWHCPYDGKTDSGKVLEYAAEIASMGVSELSVADTIGRASPWEVRELTKKLVAEHGAGFVSVHLHDTQALGLANAFAAIDAGVRILDASVAGLGGCPFAKGAAGNLATEDLVMLAHGAGLETGIDLDRLWQVVAATEVMVRKPTGGRSKAYWLSQQEIPPAPLPGGHALTSIA